MGAGQIHPNLRPGSGNGRTRSPFRRLRHSLGKNGKYNQNRGVIRTSFSKVADHRRIRDGSTGRETIGDKPMGRNATGRVCPAHGEMSLIHRNSDPPRVAIVVHDSPIPEW
jgi:hypothetical protein